jgi:hypothetical protein
VNITWEPVTLGGSSALEVCKGKGQDGGSMVNRESSSEMVAECERTSRKRPERWMNSGNELRTNGPSCKPTCLQLVQLNLSKLLTQINQ